METQGSPDKRRRDNQSPTSQRKRKRLSHHELEASALGDRGNEPNAKDEKMQAAAKDDQKSQIDIDEKEEEEDRRVKDEKMQAAAQDDQKSQIDIEEKEAEDRRTKMTSEEDNTDQNEKMVIQIDKDAEYDGPNGPEYWGQVWKGIESIENTLDQSTQDDIGKAHAFHEALEALESMKLLWSEQRATDSNENSGEIKLKIPYDGNELAEAARNRIKILLGILKNSPEEPNPDDPKPPEDVLSEDVPEGILSEVDMETYRGILRLSKEYAGHFLASKKVDEKKIEARDKKYEAKVALSKLVRHLADIREKSSEIKMQLLYLTNLSQAEGTVVQTKDAQTAYSREKQDKEMDLNDPEAGRVPPKIEPEAPAEVVFEESSHFYRPNLSNVEVPLRLKIVHAMFEAAMNGAKFLKRPKGKNELDDYKSKIGETRTELKGYFNKVMKSNDLENFLDKSREHPTITVDGIKKGLYFPGPTCQEVEGVHEIFELLLEYIGKCRRLESDGNMKHDPDENRLHDTPPRDQRCREKVVAATAVRKRRISDFTIWKEDRYVYVLTDDGFQVCFELKPGQRTNATVEEMINEVKDQLLSHMGKSVAVGFNFGPGVNSRATSIGGTLVFVTVYQLQLENVATKDASLVLNTTQELPLVSPDLFTAWFRSDERIYEKSLDTANRVKNRVYQEGQTAPQNDIPLGWKALWMISGMSHSSFFGTTWKDASDRLGKLLGSGTFGVVYEYNNNNSTCQSPEVVKVSKYGRRLDLENEAKALRFLSTKKEHKHVPEFRKFGWLRVDIGGVTRRMTALVTSPIGVPLNACIREQGILMIVGDGIESALKFIHTHGIIHNDVCPTNIIVVKIQGEQPRAVLTDFSIASSRNQVVQGFHGNVPFVHRDIHLFLRTSLWRSNPSYDFTSLGFTIAFIADGTGLCPWDGFQDRPVRSRERFDDRVSKACEALKNAEALQSSTDEKEKFNSWIDLDKKSFYHSCGCSKSGCKPSSGCGCAKKSLKCGNWCNCQGCENESESNDQDWTEQRIEDEEL